MHVCSIHLGFVYIYMLQVRKEKLGDRITALQQLVSPFGKVSDPGLNLVN
jgi:hypothetical protein